MNNKIVSETAFSATPNTSKTVAHLFSILWHRFSRATPAKVASVDKNKTTRKKLIMHLFSWGLSPVTA